MLGRGQVGSIGGWKEVLAKAQRELRATKVFLCEPGERAEESKMRGAKRPGNLTAFSTL